MWAAKAVPMSQVLKIKEKQEDGAFLGPRIFSKNRLVPMKRLRLMMLRLGRMEELVIGSMPRMLLHAL